MQDNTGQHGSLRSISLDDLPSLLHEVQEFFGEDFTLAGPQELGMHISEVRRVRARVHPLTSWWQSFERDVDRSRQRGQISISRDSACFMELYTALKYISDLPNIERIRKDLHIRTKFYSTVFETILAAMYKSKGYRVEITEEGKYQGKSTSDLLVHFGSEAIHIEAKCLDDLDEKERDLHDKMSFDLLRILEKLHRNWQLHVDFHTPATGTDCARVVRYIQKLAATEENGGTASVAGLCRITAVPLVV